MISNLTDSEYVLALIDGAFDNVPEIQAHHERLRRIAWKLAAPSRLKAEVAALRRGDCYDHAITDVLFLIEKHNPA